MQNKLQEGGGRGGQKEPRVQLLRFHGWEVNVFQWAQVLDGQVLCQDHPWKDLETGCCEPSGTVLARKKQCIIPLTA